MVRSILVITIVTFCYIGCLKGQIINEASQDSILILTEEGDKLWKEKAYLNSITNYKKALKKLILFEEWEESVSLSLELANKYRSVQFYKESIDILKKSNDVSENHIENSDSLIAVGNHKIGVAYYYLDSMKKAIQYYNKAIKIRETIFSPRSIDIIRGYNNIGGCFHKLGLLDSAFLYLNIAYNRQKNNPTKLSTITYRALARLYEDRGAFKKAEDFFLLTLDDYLNKYQKKPWNIAEFQCDLALFYLKFNKTKKSQLNAKQSIETYSKVTQKIKSDYAAMVNAYNILGLANLELEQIDEALVNFNLAKHLITTYLNENNKTLAKTITNIGNTYKHKKEFLNSEKELNEALSIFKKINLNENIADTHNNLGDLYFVQNQHQKALKNYHQSLPYLLKNFQEKDEYKNPILKDHYIPDKQALLIFLEAKAKTFKALYDQNHQEKDLIAAHQTYQLLDELIDDIRLSYLEDASKSYLVKQAKPIYEKAIGVCRQYHQYSQDKKYLAEAFKYAEKSKAIILLEQIKESRANIAASIPDSLRQKERQLKREIGQIERDLALQGEVITTDSLGKSLREQLIRVKNDYEDLVKRLEKENADYHQLKYDLQTVDIATIQQAILKEGQLLVEYFVGEDSMYLFSVGKEKFEIISRPLDFQLKEWTDSLRQGIYYCRINQEVGAKDCAALDRQYEKFATKLYQKLIRPLNLTEQTKELIIIPDGVLGYIPFDALLTKEISSEQQNQFNQYPYFGLEKVICYAFSATFLKELQQTNSTIDNYDLLAYAPSFNLGIKVENTAKIAATTKTKDPILALRSSLSPLLFNEQEVEQIGQNFGGKSYLNQQANKASFIQEAPNYRYLHIASHGKMNDEDGDLSYIAFTQVGDSTNQEELLYLRELYDMDIPADMVVLSACETGIGELQNGEGIISLARGFSYAGAKSIITSLWSVNDQKTTDLMVDFYQHLKDGETKAYALANAKRDYIATQKSMTFSHPFYWAGFVPIGNMESVQAATDWTWLGSSLFGLGLVGLLFFGFITKRYNKNLFKSA